MPSWLYVYLKFILEFDRPPNVAYLDIKAALSLWTAELCGKLYVDKVSQISYWI